MDDRKAFICHLLTRDAGTRGSGDAGTRGRGDAELILSPRLRVSVSPCRKGGSETGQVSANRIAPSEEAHPALSLRRLRLNSDSGKVHDSQSKTSRIRAVSRLTVLRCRN